MRGERTTPAEGVIRVESRAWMGVFAEPPRSVLLPVPVVQSVWYQRDVEAETRFVVDEDSLAEIDRRLCEFFSLPLSPADSEYTPG
jgi:hypothetical protein